MSNPGRITLALAAPFCYGNDAIGQESLLAALRLRVPSAIPTAQTARARARNAKAT